MHRTTQVILKNVDYKVQLSRMQVMLRFNRAFLVLLISLKVSYADVCDRKHVTVEEMRDIVIGRCYGFQTTLHPEYFCTSGLKNCTELWKKLSAAFITDEQCNVTADLYTDFIQAANHKIYGKQLFYSGLYGFVHRYSRNGVEYTTIEDTMIGHVARDVRFCGGSAGDNASASCVRYDPVKCPYTASGSFWLAASVNFAKMAVGHVYVLLNATRDPIYKSTSYFTKYEVPNLQAGTVTKLTAILINSSPSTKTDPCSTDDSLKNLKSDVEAKNIQFECDENPRDLVHLYCMDNPYTEVCRSLDPMTSTSSMNGNPCYLYLYVAIAMLKLFYSP